MFRLIQDQDCHWYLIPSDKVEEFCWWVDAITYCEEFEYIKPELTDLLSRLPDFNSMRINGPHQILIKDYELA